MLILLLRQKSAIDGSDIAELLLKDREDFRKPYSTIGGSKTNNTKEDGAESEPSSYSEREDSDASSEDGSGQGKGNREQATIKKDR